MIKISGLLAGVFLSASVAAVAIPAAADAGASRGPAISVSPASAVTEVVHVRPTGPAGRKLHRYKVVETRFHANCGPGSEAVVGAFRCFSGHGVYDPCWLQRARPFAALCLRRPWGHNVLRLRITQFGGYPPYRGGDYVWGMELGNGRRCISAQGAHSTFHGRVIDYYCPHRVAVLRGINRSQEPWLVRTITYDSSFHYHRGPLRTGVRAYIGSKSWQPGHD